MQHRAEMDYQTLGRVLTNIRPMLLSYRKQSIETFLHDFNPFQSPTSIPSENIRTPEVFDVFKGSRSGILVENGLTLAR